MTIDDKTRDQKLSYSINRVAANYRHYHQVRLINMNSLQVKKFFLLIKEELYNNLSLLIPI